MFLISEALNSRYPCRFFVPLKETFLTEDNDVIIIPWCLFKVPY